MEAIGAGRGRQETAFEKKWEALSFVHCGAMVNPMTNKGPVQIEMEGLLTTAFPDALFTVSNDSAQHHGHSGDDGSGESHFSIAIEWTGFAGMNRVARQRAVNKALGDLPGQRVHALAIKARAPGE
jgi:BolA family transcriptional regulator, general stress-responsive regulator